MQLRDQYDWVVLGDHPGALLGAGLAARLGLSVLVVPAGQRAQLSAISKSGQAIDPETSFLLGLSRASAHPGLLADGLSKLGILPAELELVQSQDCLPQVVTPAFRVELGAEFEGLAIAFKRELGGSTTDRLGLFKAYRAAERDYLKYWNELPDRLTLGADGKPKSGILRPRDFRRKLTQKSHFKSSGSGPAPMEWLRSEKGMSQIVKMTDSYPVLPLLQGLWSAIVGSKSEDPSASELLQALILSRTGASFRGGRTAYREFLVRLAKRHGVHFPEHQRCQRVFIDNGRLAGIQLGQKGNMIPVRGGIVGCGMTKIESLLNRSGGSWFSPRTSQFAADAWRFTLALTVHAEAIPPGVGSRLVWQELGVSCLEIEIQDPSHYGVNIPESKLIFLRSHLPMNESSLQLDALRMNCARMLRQAKELFPFLEFHIVRVFPDFRTHVFASQFEEYYGFKTIDDIPSNLLVYSGKGTGARGEAEGLFIVGDESYPELGSLGASVAALESVAWIAHRSGLPGPLA